MSFLQVRDLVVAYGAIQAVRGVSFDVEKGQIVSLIGSNGAGKTTTLRTISGLLRPVSGEVLLDGEPIHRMPAHEDQQSHGSPNRNRQCATRGWFLKPPKQEPDEKNHSTHRKDIA